MCSLSIMVPKSLLLYHGVAKVFLPDGLVCFAIVSLQELEWIFSLHQKRILIALVYLVLTRCEIHHNDIFKALRHETYYVIWPTPEGRPNDKQPVQFFLKSHKVKKPWIQFLFLSKSKYLPTR